MQLTKYLLVGGAGLALLAGAQTPPAAPAPVASTTPAAPPAPTGAAAASPTRVLTLEETVKLALEHNLDIQIQRLALPVDRFQIGVTEGAYDPVFKFTANANYSATPSSGFIQGTTIPLNPNIVSTTSYTPDISGTLQSGLTYDISGPLSDSTSPTGTIPGYAHYNTSPGITLRQPLLKNLWIDNPRYQILLNKYQLRVDEAGLRLQIMTTVNNTKAAFFNLIYARDNVQVKDLALKLAQQLLTENRKKVEVGSLAPLDEKQAQSQAASAKADLIAAEQALVAQENVLIGLITDKFSEWSGVRPVPAESLVAVPPELNLQDSLRDGIAKRPDYLQAKLQVESQNITVRYTRNQVFPELDITGSYGRRATDPGFESAINDVTAGNTPYYSAGVFVSIPLGNRAASNNYKAAKETVKQLLAKMKKSELGIVIAIDNDVKTVRSDYERVQATREASAYAKDALDAEQKKLENGKSTSFVVLQLQSNLTSAKSAELRALADFNIAVQQLAFDDGTLLERSHIGVSVK